MARGRKAESTPLKLLKGGQPCRANRGEAAPAAGRPQPPERFGDEAKAEWHALCDRLEAIGVLNPSHAHALALYCGAYSRLLVAEQALAERGALVETARYNKEGVEVGSVVKGNPAAGIAAAAESIMLRVLVEFGLTAASVSKVKAKPEGEQDALAAFLAKRKV